MFFEHRLPPYLYREGREQMKTDKSEMNAFHRVVDTLCANKGLSQRKFADEIGISEVTLSRYLRGERKVQLMPFMRMCRILDINPESLYKTYLFACLEDRVARYREEHGRE